MDFVFLDNGEHAAQAWGLKPPVTASLLRCGTRQFTFKEQERKSTYKSPSPGKRRLASEDRALGNHWRACQLAEGVQCALQIQEDAAVGRVGAEGGDSLTVKREVGRRTNNGRAQCDFKHWFVAHIP